tara:strand:- start:2118 stop:3308 length:1191 start_codon:yes stop_codon:yes gene_type:complete
MIFQILDNKIECAGFYCNGKIVKEEVPKDFTQTWDASTNFLKNDVEYAKLYSQVDSIEEVELPSDLKEAWKNSNKTMRSFINSLYKAKVSLDEHCFYDLVPERFLVDYCENKNKITKFIFENFSKPPNYQFLSDINLFLTRISNQKLNIDKRGVNKLLTNKADFSAIQRFLNSSERASYNIFKSKTGRLSTKKNSFPILAFTKKFRSILKPNNHWFLELDFNANELRVLIALNGEKQPEGDVHEWNIKNVFNGRGTRDEAKKRVFAWLYNPDSGDSLLSKFYDKEKILSEYYKNGRIVTPYDRTIEADDFHALNYLIQSTASDLCLKQTLKIDKILKGRKSKITAVIHDSVLIDYNEEDRECLKDLVAAYGETDFGNFKVNVSAGVNYGKMKSLCK